MPGKFRLLGRAVALFLSASLLIQDLSAAAALETTLWANPPATDPALVKFSPSVAGTREWHKGPRGRLLIHIQDAHTNLSAQENLAEVLKALIRRYRVKTLFAEGGSRNESLAFLRPLAGKDARERVAKKYLLRGRMNGAEYFSLASDEELAIEGVEDPALYEKNLKSYAAIVKKREGVLAYLDEIAERISIVKRRLYPEAIVAFDDFLERFRAGEEDFTEYAGRLEEGAARYRVSLLGFPNFLSLRNLKAREATIDFPRANEEQDRLIRLLVSSGAVRAEEIRNLAGPVDRVKSRTYNPYGFYRTLMDTAKSAGIDLSGFPNLERYAEYLKIYSGVQAEDLLEETDLLTEMIYRAALTDPDAVYLRQIADHTENLKGLFSLRISSGHFEKYAARKDDLRFKTVVCLAFLNQKLMEYGNVSDVIHYLPLVSDHEKEVEDFYRTARERDEVFVRRALARMEAKDIPAAALLAGGYHTDHLKELLKQEGVSYVVVTPNVTQETNLKRYEEILLGGLKDKPRFSTIPKAVTAGQTDGLMPRWVAEQVANVDRLQSDLTVGAGVRLTKPKTSVRPAGLAPLPAESVAQLLENQGHRIAGEGTEFSVNKALINRDYFPELNDGRFWKAGMSNISGAQSNIAQRELRGNVRSDRGDNHILMDAIESVGGNNESWAPFKRGEISERKRDKNDVGLSKTGHTPSRRDYSRSQRTSPRTLKVPNQPWRFSEDEANHAEASAVRQDPHSRSPLQSFLKTTRFLSSFRSPSGTIPHFIFLINSSAVKPASGLMQGWVLEGDNPGLVSPARLRSDLAAGPGTRAVTEGGGRRAEGGGQAAEGGELIRLREEVRVWGGRVTEKINAGNLEGAEDDFRELESALDRLLRSPSAGALEDLHHEIKNVIGRANRLAAKHLDRARDVRSLPDLDRALAYLKIAGEMLKRHESTNIQLEAFFFLVACAKAPGVSLLFFEEMGVLMRAPLLERLGGLLDQARGFYESGEFSSFLKGNDNKKDRGPFLADAYRMMRSLYSQADFDTLSQAAGETAGRLEALWDPGTRGGGGRSALGGIERAVGTVTIFLHPHGKGYLKEDLSVTSLPVPAGADPNDETAQDQIAQIVKDRLEVLIQEQNPDKVRLAIADASGRVDLDGSQEILLKAANALLDGLSPEQSEALGKIDFAAGVLGTEESAALPASPLARSNPAPIVRIPGPGAPRENGSPPAAIRVESPDQKVELPEGKDRDWLVRRGQPFEEELRETLRFVRSGFKPNGVRTTEALVRQAGKHLRTAWQAEDLLNGAIQKLRAADSNSWGWTSSATNDLEKFIAKPANVEGDQSFRTKLSPPALPAALRWLDDFISRYSSGASHFPEASYSDIQEARKLIADLLADYRAKESTGGGLQSTGNGVRLAGFEAPDEAQAGRLRAWLESLSYVRDSRLVNFLFQLTSRNESAAKTFAGKRSNGSLVSAASTAASRNGVDLDELVPAQENLSPIIRLRRAILDNGLRDILGQKRSSRRNSEAGKGTAWKNNTDLFGLARRSSRPGLSGGRAAESLSELLSLAEDAAFREIVIAEDRPFTRQTWKEWSSLALPPNLKVVILENGQKALDYWSAHRSRVGLIISDNGMPKMSGKKLLEKIRESGSHVPFILTSGERVLIGPDENLVVANRSLASSRNVIEVPKTIPLDYSMGVIIDVAAKLFGRSLGQARPSPKNAPAGVAGRPENPAGGRAAVEEFGAGSAGSLQEEMERNQITHRRPPEGGPDSRPAPRFSGGSHNGGPIHSLSVNRKTGALPLKTLHPLAEDQIREAGLLMVQARRVSEDLSRLTSDSSLSTMEDLLNKQAASLSRAMRLLRQALPNASQNQLHTAKPVLEGIAAVAGELAGNYRILSAAYHEVNGSKETTYAKQSAKFSDWASENFEPSGGRFATSLAQNRLIAVNLAMNPGSSLVPMNSRGSLGSRLGIIPQSAVSGPTAKPASEVGMQPASPEDQAAAVALYLEFVQRSQVYRSEIVKAIASKGRFVDLLIDNYSGLRVESFDITSRDDIETLTGFFRITPADILHAIQTEFGTKPNKKFLHGQNNMGAYFYLRKHPGEKIYTSRTNGRKGIIVVSSREILQELLLWSKSGLLPAGLTFKVTEQTNKGAYQGATLSFQNQDETAEVFASDAEAIVNALNRLAGWRSALSPESETSLSLDQVKAVNAQNRLMAVNLAMNPGSSLVPMNSRGSWGSVIVVPTSLGTLTAPGVSPPTVIANSFRVTPDGALYRSASVFDFEADRPGPEFFKEGPLNKSQMLEEVRHERRKATPLPIPTYEVGKGEGSGFISDIRESVARLGAGETGVVAIDVNAFFDSNGDLRASDFSGILQRLNSSLAFERLKERNIRVLFYGEHPHPQAIERKLQGIGRLFGGNFTLSFAGALEPGVGLTEAIEKAQVSPGVHDPKLMSVIYAEKNAGELALRPGISYVQMKSSARPGETLSAMPLLIGLALWSNPDVQSLPFELRKYLQTTLVFTVAGKQISIPVFMPIPISEADLFFTALSRKAVLSSV
ncbi:MAG: response regulator [Candidatus Omnitrophica bacterium]|nr:response regulator [Candidatus Omnitrophota bacterium]